MTGIERFHEYVYGRSFELITNHKLLLGLIVRDQQIPSYMSPRMTSWSIFLTGYNYKLVHHLGKSISNADALSRCPVPDLVEDPALHLTDPND